MRHAQRHWLEAQAKKAVETAQEMSLDELESTFFDVEMRSAEWRQMLPPEAAQLKMARASEEAIRLAALNLVISTLFHREAVRLGGGE